MTFPDFLIGVFALATLTAGGMAILAQLPTPVRWSRWPARIALAHLIAAATMAWIVTVLGLASGRLSVLPIYGLFVFFAALAWKARTHRAAMPPKHPRQKESPTDIGNRWRQFATFATFAGIVLTGTGLIGHQIMGIDSDVIWAIKAKAFFIAHSFSPLQAHCCSKSSYPVLLPLQSWWIYQHLRHVNDWWHQAIGYLFFLDTVVLTFEACRTRTRTVWAWTAAAIVATSPVQVLVSTKGFADSALAAFFTASALFIASYLSDRNEFARPLALLMLLGALQTKNEGLVWVTVAIALMAIMEMRWKLYRRAAATVALYLVAIAPWMIYKRLHHMAYTPEEQYASIHVLQTYWLPRLTTVLRAHLTDLLPSAFVFLMILCLPLIYLSWRHVSRIVLSLVLVQFLSYVVIYLIVKDQQYQLTGFLDRGFSHIAPALVCISVIGYQAYAGSTQNRSEEKRENLADEEKLSTSQT